MSRMVPFAKSAALALGLTLVAGAAQAASPCTAEAPKAGAEIHGPVLHVLDGRTLCVALGFSPSEWVPLRLADGPAAAEGETRGAAGRGALMATAFSQNVTCRIEGQADGLATGTCTLEGRSVGELSRGAASQAAGQAWR